VTYDSGIVKYIEIIPLDRPADDYCKPGFIEPVVEFKSEDLQDVKLEPVDENNTEDWRTTYMNSVKVRFW